MHTYTHTRVITWLVYTWRVSFRGICVCECASVSMCVCVLKCAYYMRLIYSWHASLVPSACAHMRVCVWKCVHTWDLHGASTRAKPHSVPSACASLCICVCAWKCLHTWDLHESPRVDHSWHVTCLIQWYLRVRVCACVCSCESAYIHETCMARCLLTYFSTLAPAPIEMHRLSYIGTPDQRKRLCPNSQRICHLRERNVKT